METSLACSVSRVAPALTHQYSLALVCEKTARGFLSASHRAITQAGPGKVKKKVEPAPGPSDSTQIRPP